MHVIFGSDIGEPRLCTSQYSLHKADMRHGNAVAYGPYMMTAIARTVESQEMSFCALPKSELQPLDLVEELLRLAELDMRFKLHGYQCRSWNDVQYSRRGHDFVRGEPR